MRVPMWLTLGVAVIVMIFGVYRISMAFRTQDKLAKPRRGLYAMGRRTHLLIGVVYLLLGGALTATSFGWNPFGRFVGPETETPTKDTAPTKAKLPVDQLPTKK